MKTSNDIEPATRAGGRGGIIISNRIDDSQKAMQNTNGHEAYFK